MAKLNPYFPQLPRKYIFPIIEDKLEAVKKKFPDKEVLNLGVGDIALPLLPKIAEAVQAAVHEMTEQPRGYGPSEGYLFLRETICQHEYAAYRISPQEIFISDGACTDATSIQELFDTDSVVAITDPTYPAYLDANIIAGKKILLIPTKEEDSFIPKPPKESADLVYLCTPCNPTGVALNYADLQEWVDWAKKHKAILLIDNVYNAFISSDEIPPSIYAIEGAKEVAIEMRSFSKSAGFTGLRCGYMVIPKTLHLSELHSMWMRRVSAKSNGVSYPIQKGAACCFQPEVMKQLKLQLATYQLSSKLLRESLKNLNQTFFGGEHAPYIWWKTPAGTTSWEFFDHLLTQCQIITIPGSGFSSCGEGYVRLSCFLTEHTAKKAQNALHGLFATT